VAEELTKVLADSFAVYLKTHGYHWNVRGPEFFSFHNLLEQQYTDMWNALDDIAERIRALGVLAPQSYPAFGNLTSIKDGDPEKEATAMLKELMQDHETLIATARKALDVASDAGDEALRRSDDPASRRTREVCLDVALDLGRALETGAFRPEIRRHGQLIRPSPTRGRGAGFGSRSSRYRLSG
jgi:starvation-inducible DNA-binding protein